VTIGETSGNLLYKFQVTGSENITGASNAGSYNTAGTITSGLINGQTISSAANFTGTVAVNGLTLATNRVNMTSGTNLHLDPFSTGAVYLAWYSGTGGVVFGNGAVGSRPTPVQISLVRVLASQAPRRV
jgi:hypothetical protein